MTTRRKTGEPQKTEQPFKIDRLPVAVHEAITDLHNAKGKSWETIERFSAEPFGEKQLGFVEWDKLDTEVLALFPDKRIPSSSLHRWYDVRVKQASQAVRERSSQARVIAEAFAKASVEGSHEAVLNAARDQLMVVLAEDGSVEGRIATAKALTGLAVVMQSVRANDIKERKVAVEEQVLQLKIEEMQRKAQALLDEVEGGKGDSPRMTNEQLAARIRETYGLTG